MWTLGILCAILALCTDAFILPTSLVRRSVTSMSSVPVTSTAASPVLTTLVVAANKFASAPQGVKTTVIDDPTAGMTPDQITDYISNVGGGMCGNDGLGQFIGLGLNLSLIVFGFFTVSYVIMGGLSFKYTKDTEELVTKAIGMPSLTNKADDRAAVDSQFGPVGVSQPIGNFGSIEGEDEIDGSGDGRGVQGTMSGPNREERRLARRVSKKE